MRVRLSREREVLDAEGGRIVVHVLTGVQDAATTERVARQRLELARMIADFIDEQTERLGEILHMDSLTLARLSLACSDGLQLAAFLDPGQEDLYEPFLALLVTAIEDDPKKKTTAKKK